MGGLLILTVMGYCSATRPLDAEMAVVTAVVVLPTLLSPLNSERPDDVPTWSREVVSS